VKGDAKSTAIYSARLVLDYDGEAPPPPPTGVDVALDAVFLPSRTVINSAEGVAVILASNGPDDAGAGTVSIIGITNRGETIEFTDTFSGLAVGDRIPFVWLWETPSQPSTVNWTAKVTVTDGDSDLSNNEATGITRVRR
jgi:hypothetical protein